MKNLPYVTGVITAVELVEIPSKAMNKPARYETRISLKVISAFNHKGDVLSVDAYDYPHFAGDSCLVEQFKVDQKVKIVCSSKTGRHIQGIEVIK